MASKADGESTPLLGGNKDHRRTTSNSSSYYFLQQNAGAESSADDAATNRSGVTAVHENMPAGSQPDDFGPKLLTRNTKHPSLKKETPQQQQQQQANKQNVDSQWGGGGKGKLGIFNVFLGISGNGNNNDNGNQNTSNPQGGPPVMDDTVQNQRKAPIKIEPKVFFSNERTFLAWMHISVILAGASIFILALTPVDDGSGGGGTRLPEKQLYGIITLPVAVAFIVYSMYHYVNRAYMIRNKQPGPYSNSVGPAILTFMLMLSIICQFGIKLYSIKSNRSSR